MYNEWEWEASVNDAPETYHAYCEFPIDNSGMVCAAKTAVCYVVKNSPYKQSPVKNGQHFFIVCSNHYASDIIPQNDHSVVNLIKEKAYAHTTT